MERLLALRPTSPLFSVARLRALLYLLHLLHLLLVVLMGTSQTCLRVQGQLEA